MTCKAFFIVIFIVKHKFIIFLLLNLSFHQTKSGLYFFLFQFLVTFFLNFFLCFNATPTFEMLSKQERKNENYFLAHLNRAWKFSRQRENAHMNCEIGRWNYSFMLGWETKHKQQQFRAFFSCLVSYLGGTILLCVVFYVFHLLNVNASFIFHISLPFVPGSFLLSTSFSLPLFLLPLILPWLYLFS